MARPVLRRDAMTRIEPIVVLVTAIALGGCTSEEPIEEGERLQLAAPAVGQHSRYQLLTGESYADPDESPFAYQDAVLVVEVVDRDGDDFVVHEYFEPDAALPEDLASWLEPEEVYEYRVTVADGAFEVAFDDETRPRLFPLYPGTSLPLAEVAEPETEVFGWKTSLPYCECETEAYIAGGSINGASYPRLNVTVENTGMQVDGPGTTYVYDVGAGLVRSIHYSWWTSTGHGFDLIPE